MHARTVQESIQLLPSLWKCHRASPVPGLSAHPCTNDDFRCLPMISRLSVGIDFQSMVNLIPVLRMAFSSGVEGGMSLDVHAGQ